MWNDVWNWLNEYSTGVIAFSTAGIGGTALILARKYLFKLGQNLINLVIKVVVKLYGGNVDEDDVTRAFTALPFVQDLQTQVQKTKEDDELKLVQIKQKILSPKLSELERLSYEYQYNMLYNKLDKAMSESTKSILEKMEALARKNNI